MDNSTEELTPILVPFEKNIRSNSGGTYDYNPFRNESAWESNTERAVAGLHSEEGRRANPMLGPGSEYGRRMHGDHPEGYMQTQPSDDPVSSTSEQKKNAEKYGPDALTGPGSEYYSKMHGANTQSTSSGAQSASSNTQSSSTSPRGGNWTGGRGLDHVPGLMSGAAVAANLGASIAGGLDKAGQASRKLIQGILNPGLMGQNAANTSMEAMDTIVTPDEASRVRQANLNEAMNLAGETWQLNEQSKAQKQADAMRNQLNGSLDTAMQNIFHRYNIPGPEELVLGNDVNGNPLSIAQYKSFVDEFEPIVRQTMLQWSKQGVDPKVANDIAEQYLFLLDKSKERFKHGTVTAPEMGEKVLEANEKAQTAQSNLQATDQVWNAATSHKGAIDQLANNIHPDLMKILNTLPGVEKYTDGTVDMSSVYSNYFVDGNGNRISDVNDQGQSIFDPNTARLDLSAFSNDDLDAIRRVDPSLAKEIEAQIKEDDLYKQEVKNDGDFEGLSRYLKRDAHPDNSVYSNLPTNMTMQDADNYLDAASDSLWNTLGPELSKMGIDKQKYLAFKAHGGLSSTNADDYEIYKAFVDAHNKRLQNDASLLQSAQNKISKGLPLTMEEEAAIDLNDTMVIMRYKADIMREMREYDSENNIATRGDRVSDYFGMRELKKVQDLTGYDRARAKYHLENALKECNKALIQSKRALDPNGGKVGPKGKYQKYSPANPTARNNYIAESIRSGQTSMWNDPKFSGLGPGAGNTPGPYSIPGRLQAVADEINASRDAFGKERFDHDTGVPEQVFSETQDAFKAMAQVTRGGFAALAGIGTFDEFSGANNVDGLNYMTFGLPSTFFQKYNIGIIDPKDLKNVDFDEAMNAMDTVENQFVTGATPQTQKDWNRWRAAADTVGVFRMNFAATAAMPTLAKKIASEMKSNGTSATLDSIATKWYTQRTGLSPSDPKIRPGYTFADAQKEVQDMLNDSTFLANQAIHMASKVGNKWTTDMAIAKRNNIFGKRQKNVPGSTSSDRTYLKGAVSKWNGKRMPNLSKMRGKGGMNNDSYTRNLIALGNMAIEELR